MNSIHPTIAAAVCPQCGSHIAAAMLACPGCGRLVHADRLKCLAEAASAAQVAGELATALGHWREALELLPPNSRQFAVISDKIVAISREIDSLPLGSEARRIATRGADQTVSPASGVPAGARTGEKGDGDTTSRGTLGAAAIAAFMFLITKGKLLIVGLTKAGTFFSMLASMSIYWAAYGWKFAVGLVVSIYIHEMGHVAMLRRYGVKASAPMFIPGLGAVVLLKQHFATPIEDARVGLAGPIWGLGAAVGAYIVALLAGWPSWAAIAHVGAWINLFNLTPFWQLDGGRAFNAMTKRQRWIAVFAILIAWTWVHDGMLVLVGLVAAGRALSPQAPSHPDRRAMGEYVFLIATLSAMLKIPVSMDGLIVGP